MSSTDGSKVERIAVTAFDSTFIYRQLHFTKIRHTRSSETWNCRRKLFQWLHATNGDKFHWKFTQVHWRKISLRLPGTKSRWFRPTVTKYGGKYVPCRKHVTTTNDFVESWRWRTSGYNKQKAKWVKPIFARQETAVIVIFARCEAAERYFRTVSTVYSSCSIRWFFMLGYRVRMFVYMMMLPRIIWVTSNAWRCVTL